MTSTHIVKIGEICIGKENEVLKATLGSCVGIGLFWSKKNIVSLAHCLLPETSNPKSKLGAKYVNQAVLSLIELMKIHPKDMPEIKAIVVGGGYMMPLGKSSGQKHIGLQNVEAARKILGELGVKIFFEDVGGNQGRQIVIDCKSEEFNIKKIDKQ